MPGLLPKTIIPLMICVANVKFDGVWFIPRLLSDHALATTCLDTPRRCLTMCGVAFFARRLDFRDAPMSLIIAENVGLRFGDHEVLRAINFRIAQSDRIGLVGANGEGKTCLLRIIGGMLESTTGDVHRRRGLTAGYLPQDPPAPAGRTVHDTMLDVFADVRKMEDDLHDLAGRMGDDAAAVRRYATMESEFEALGGYGYTTRIRQVLTGLGFGGELWDRPLAQLSGGERTRAYLAALLLRQPDVLLLDEPTNHLDIDSCEWLERWLGSFRGALVIVSHDRYMLDRVTAATWELAFRGLETYKGSYTKFVKLRAARHHERMRTWEAQQEYITKTREFIRIHIAGQRSREAQGRRKRLERFLRDEAIDQPQEQRAIHLEIAAGKRTGDLVLRATDLDAGYAAADPLLHVDRLEIERGQRIAIVGPNGSGKTTLLRTLLGELDPLDGEVITSVDGIDTRTCTRSHIRFDPSGDKLLVHAWKDCVALSEDETWECNDVCRHRCSGPVLLLEASTKSLSTLTTGFKEWLDDKDNPLRFNTQGSLDTFSSDGAYYIFHSLGSFIVDDLRTCIADTGKATWLDLEHEDKQELFGQPSSTIPAVDGRAIYAMMDGSGGSRLVVIADDYLAGTLERSELSAPLSGSPNELHGMTAQVDEKRVLASMNNELKAELYVVETKEGGPEATLLTELEPDYSFSLILEERWAVFKKHIQGSYSEVMVIDLDDPDKEICSFVNDEYHPLLSRAGLLEIKKDETNSAVIDLSSCSEVVALSNVDMLYTLPQGGLLYRKADTAEVVLCSDLDCTDSLVIETAWHLLPSPDLTSFAIAHNPVPLVDPKTYQLSLLNTDRMELMLLDSKLEAPDSQGFFKGVLRFSPSGRWLLWFSSSSGDEQIVLYDVNGPHGLRSTGMGEHLSIFSGDESYLYLYSGPFSATQEYVFFPLVP